MFIHQEANDTTCEGWINSDKISYIGKKRTSTTFFYECYLTGDAELLTITEEILNKILVEKGVM